MLPEREGLKAGAQDGGRRRGDTLDAPAIKGKNKRLLAYGQAQGAGRGDTGPPPFEERRDERLRLREVLQNE